MDAATARRIRIALASISLVLAFVAVPTARGEVAVTVHTLIPPGASFTDGLSLGPDGTLYASDALGPGTLSNPQGTAIRKIAADLTVTTYATGMSVPIGNALDAAGNLYVANWGSVIKKIAPDGTVTTFAGITNCAGIAVDSQGNVFVSRPSLSRIVKITPSGTTSAYYVGAPLSTPIGLAVDENDRLYIANFGDGRIHVIDPATPSVATLVASVPGNGNGATGMLSYRNGKLFVPGNANCRVYMVDVAGGQVTVLAGTGVSGYVDGPGESAQFGNPNGCAISAGGDTLFLTDDVDRSLRILVIEEVTTSVEGPVVPRLGGVSVSSSPNPFRDATTLSFSLAEGGHIRLRIYDAGGRLVRTLADGDAAPGHHFFTWDGTSSGGRPVSPGTYFYRLSGDGVSSRGKLVWLP